MQSLAVLLGLLLLRPAASAQGAGSFPGIVETLKAAWETCVADRAARLWLFLAAAGSLNFAFLAAASQLVETAVAAAVSEPGQIARALSCRRPISASITARRMTLHRILASSSSSAGCRLFGSGDELR